MLSAEALWLANAEGQHEVVVNVALEQQLFRYAKDLLSSSGQKERATGVSYIMAVLSSGLKIKRWTSIRELVEVVLEVPDSLEVRKISDHVRQTLTSYFLKVDFRLLMPEDFMSLDELLIILGKNGLSAEGKT